MGTVREDATFTDAEGVVVHHYRWPAGSTGTAQPRGIVQLIHGLGEYATRYEQFGLVDALVTAGWTVVAEDHRGHGATGVGQWGRGAKLGRPGPGGWRALVRDVHRLTALARKRDPGLPLVLLGHSLGSIIAQQLIETRAADYDAVVLSGTAYRTLPHMNSGDLNARHAKQGPTTAEWLSRDRAVVDAFVADPLAFEAKAAQSYGIIDGLRLLGTPHHLARDLPMYIVIGEEDPLGGPDSVELLARAYGARGGLSDVTLKIYPGARHEVFNETNRNEVFADLIAWLEEHVPAPREPAVAG